MPTSSYWDITTALPRFPELEQDLSTEVVVVGAGICGVTAAYLLSQAGRKVVLLDRAKCGGGYTSYTTAHVTYVTDIRLHQLVQNFGRQNAKAVWDSQRAAIGQISDIVDAEGIDCEFKTVPGYLHLPPEGATDEDRKLLKRDVELAEEFDFSAVVVKSVPLIEQFGVLFANQAKFHPLNYLAGLLRALSRRECPVYERGAVAEIGDGVVVANNHKISCEYVVVATHAPILGKAGALGATLFQSKIHPYSTYAIGAKLPVGTVQEALFWDTADPYGYLRLDQRGEREYAIYGGADHKTGQKGEGEDPFALLEARLKGYLPGAEVQTRWSGQVLETADGLPFIGETAEGQFVCTGFSGTGMTFGTLGAMMACDAACGRDNPWQQLYSPGRKKLSAAVEYVTENLDYPYYFLRDRLRAAESQDPASLAPGEGKILRLNGRRVAAYRDRDGKLTTLSPVCPHMGCIVRWNELESTWDCPCHGSRFRASGELLAGPAEKPLDSAE